MAKQKTLIGMVGLPPLPGTADYSGASIEDIISFAVNEARMLDQAGFDGVMVQNVNDIPSRNKVYPEIIAYMTRISAEVRKVIKPESLLGISILKNEGAGAVGAASAAAADFIRLKVYVGAMVGAEGVINGCYEEVLEARQRLGAKIKLWADIHDRTGTPLGQQSLEEAVGHAVKVGRADVAIITGKTFAQSLEWIDNVKETLPGVKVFIGGGVTPDNLHSVMAKVDGAIVGSCFKKDGMINAPIDPDRLSNFMSGYRQFLAGGCKDAD